MLFASVTSVIFFKQHSDIYFPEVVKKDESLLLNVCFSDTSKNLHIYKKGHVFFKSAIDPRTLNPLKLADICLQKKDTSFLIGNRSKNQQPKSYKKHVNNAILYF